MEHKNNAEEKNEAPAYVLYERTFDEKKKIQFFKSILYLKIAFTFAILLSVHSLLCLKSKYMWVYVNLFEQE